MLIIGLESARKGLPELLDRAYGGEAFVIEKRGQPYAVLVPPGDVGERSAGSQGEDLFALRGSGEGLWADDIVSTIDDSRDEWVCRQALLNNEEIEAMV